MHELNGTEQTMMWGVIVVAIISLIYALWLWRDTIRRDKGTQKMKKVPGAIKAGRRPDVAEQLEHQLPDLCPGRQ